MNNKLKRRNFLALVGLSVLGNAFSARVTPMQKKIAPFTTLFQGDSITDGNRGRSDDPNHILGHGYAFGIASLLGAEYPERQLSFINKGNSGDTISALLARWKTDALDLKPDAISILVGINDVLHRIRSGNFSAPSTYERDFRKLIELTREALPGTKIILCEPFILPVGMTLENPERWANEVNTIQQVCLQLATEFDFPYVRFQRVFNDALKTAPASYWIWDGIHPTVSGHGLMAKEWMREVGKVMPELKSR
jgi:lysophospholipase L1-like esterase